MTGAASRFCLARLACAGWLAMWALTGAVRADPAEPHQTELQKLLPDLSIGPVTFGGAARANVLVTNYDDSISNPQHVAFDTAWLDASLDYRQFYGYAQFRFYDSVGVKNSFFHSGWLGYHWDDHRQNVKLGITKVPFGVLPFASNNYFFSLAYYVGLEDDYDFGLTYSFERDDWTFKAAYFPREEWQGFGDSSIDSSRYSYDVVRSPTSANQERHQFNLWAQRKFEINSRLTASPGVSAMYKMIPNSLTNATGGMWAAGAHTQISYGQFDAKLEYAHYDYRLKNPPGQSNAIVVMGAYGAPYNVAAEADILIASLSYAFPLENEVFQSITIYNDYSVILKNDPAFPTTQQNVTGAFLNMDPFKVYVEAAWGRNNPFIGSNYTDALASGGTNTWQFRFNINAGFYF